MNSRTHGPKHSLKEKLERYKQTFPLMIIGSLRSYGTKARSYGTKTLKREPKRTNG